jgi:predicted dehydrogenase
VIIALPLHLHATATVEAMQSGKHVLTEKLMAHNVAQCKVMGRVSEETNRYLATGHQRHYSILYDNAVHLIKWGLLGQLHYIRAQWHRGNVPGKDSWAPPIPGGELSVEDGKLIDVIGGQLKSLISKKTAMEKALAAGRAINPDEYELLSAQVKQWNAWDADKTVAAEEYSYENLSNFYGKGVDRTALEELIRWRIWDRTGGGLMAELGSHQLDAASIFISALNKEKVHPLAVHAVGGRHIFPKDRDAGDHVYCMFEFPAPEYAPGFNPGYKDKVLDYPNPKEAIPGYVEDQDKKIVVTYSSINGNGFGGYGEIVMGTKGTLILEKEQEVMLYKSGSTSTKIGVKAGEGGAVLDTQESGDTGPAKAAEETGPISRGYAEEIEHWAWCIQNPAPENQPRCGPKVALGDAVLALTAKLAIRNANEGKDTGGYIRFKEEWFDPNSDEVPEEITVNSEISNLNANLPLS